ncbi:hypothetical protein H5T56_05385 [Candidatus Bipolaricaulota bacterium]|nr:hypothetical protein [Candidatus Bipolaricaulota bacterium]
MKRGVFWCVLVVGIFIVEAGLSQTMELGEVIYIGESFPVIVNVEDTLVVLNLNNPAKVYEFKVDKPGTTIELCFVRPCDHPCEGVPTERIVLANPGDQILFVLKRNPQKDEVRRAVYRSREEPLEVNLTLAGKDAKRYLCFKVEYKPADLTCNPDTLPIEFFIHDEGKLATLKLKETGPATGEFVGTYPVEISYAEGKFTVRYEYERADSQKELEPVVVALPDLPKVTVRVGGAQFILDLVTGIDTAVLNEVPSEFRLDGYCSFVLEFIRGIIQSHYAPTAEVFVEVREGKLYVVVKDGCQYYAGIKDVKVLPPVQLVIKDEKGNVVRGGHLDAAKTYKIEAMNGLADGCVLIVELGCTDNKCCQTLRSAMGAFIEWAPEQGREGKTFAIIYVDKYLCNPPALIVTVY